jgi:hypothetical protein
MNKSGEESEELANKYLIGDSHGLYEGTPAFDWRDIL